MTVPGLALFYAGLVRAKNVVSMLTQVLAIVCLVAIIWVVYGYSLAFTGGSTIIGGLDKLFLKGVTADSQAATFSVGVPIIVLTTVGAKSGKLRKTALMRVEHDGRYAVVASKGGAPDEPRWAGNMRRHPHVELQDGAVKRDYLARELSGDERAEWWKRSTAVWPDYDNYQTKTDRQIAVFLLEPFEH